MLHVTLNTDVAYVPAANVSQKFSNDWLNTLLPLWVCFNPHTHPCFCDVFNYVSPGSGDSELLITLLSSLEQNYSTKRESSWLTMQLVIPTMCQNYDATLSVSLHSPESLALSVVLSRSVRAVYFHHPSCHALPDLRLKRLSIAFWQVANLIAMRFIWAGQRVYNPVKCLLC